MHKSRVYGNVPLIVLASASPRRKQLMQEMGLECVVDVPEFDERSVKPVGDCTEIPLLLAKGKLNSLMPKYANEQELRLVIAADTLVFHEGEQIGKPESAEDALRLLNRLSNEWHLVITGVALGYGRWRDAFTCTTRVKFGRLDSATIMDYVDSGSSMDKAGGYGIQNDFGLCAVESIEGSFPNVVGLPTQLLHTYLMDHFA